MAAKEAVHFIGMPEGNTALAQAAIYLATAPKSNAVYRAYLDAAEAAATDVAEPVPLHLRNAPTGLMKALDYGKGYKYAHDEPEGVAEMDCLPPAHRGRRFYAPTDRGFEAELREAHGEEAAGWRGAERAAHLRAWCRTRRNGSAREGCCRTGRFPGPGRPSSLVQVRDLLEHLFRSGRMNEKRKSPCIRPIGMPTSSPVRLRTPPPDTPGWPSVRQVTRLLAVRWPT